MSEMLMSVKDKRDDQNCRNNGGLTPEDFNNNCLKSHSKSQDSSDEVVFKMGEGKTALEKKQCEQQKEGRHENGEKSRQEKNGILEKQIEEDKIDDLCVSKKEKNDHIDRKSGDCDILHGNKNSEDAQQRSRRDAREKPRSNSDNGGFGPQKESNKKSKPSRQSSKDDGESVSAESSDKYSLKLDDVKDDRSLEKSKRRKKERKRRRHNSSKERHVSWQHKQESESKEHSKHKSKKAKIKHKDRDRDSDQEEPSKSFESYLNYDVNVRKRKEQGGLKKPLKKIKTGAKEEAAKDCDMKPARSPVMSVNVSPPKQVIITLLVYYILYSK